MSKLISFTVIFIVIALLSLLIRNSKNTEKTVDFDERQLILRSDAYKHAFYTILMYCVMYSFIVAILGRSIMEDGVSTQIGACLGVLVFAVDCIRNDVFFTVRNKPASYLVLLSVNVVINGIPAIDKIRKGLVIQHGLLTSDCFQLVISIIFLIAILAILFKLMSIRQEEE